ncbi:ROK family protein [Nocardioides dongxiaopingii]|uniref:ROK family protein n=1 Tax=Nocardioides TaxID=1839 RepID=UPI0010C76E00|nr:MULTISPECIES: ROK family protein [Nocardioides]QCW51217.1 ROK family protein [Nocardioides sp. S-1144]
MVLYIGVDVGGTKVLAGEVTRAGTVVRTARRSTPGRRVSVASVEDALTEAVLDVAAGRRIAGVGLAAAGFVDAAGERVMFAPHLPWAGERVRERLSRRWGAPVALDNDANCAAVAETAFGAARGSSSALMITLGTGIGGAIVMAGQLVRGAQGMAGEFGHMQVVPDGRNCECGMSGCWEQYCSGNALVRFARAHLDPGPSILTDLCDARPEQLTGPMVTAAAEQGDPVAGQAFAAIGEWLGVGLGGLTSAFDPELVVVGGGVSAAGDRLLEPARAALARTVVGAGHRTPPQVVGARLGPEAGLIGAALLSRSARWAGSARSARTARSVRGVQTIGAGDYRSGVIKPRRRRPDRGARGSS